MSDFDNVEIPKNFEYIYNSNLDGVTREELIYLVDKNSSISEARAKSLGYVSKDSFGSSDFFQPDIDEILKSNRDAEKREDLIEKSGFVPKIGKEELSGLKDQIDEEYSVLPEEVREQAYTRLENAVKKGKKVSSYMIRGALNESMEFYESRNELEDTVINAIANGNEDRVLERTAPVILELSEVLTENGEVSQFELYKSIENQEFGNKIRRGEIIEN